MNLYEMSHELKKLESEEWDEQTLQDTLEALGFDDKLENCIAYYKNLLAQQAAYKAESDRLSSEAKKAKGKADWLQGYIQECLTVADKEQFSSGVHSVKFKKLPPKLGAIDEDKVPEEFRKMVVTESVDKRALLKAVKENPIDGVELITGEKGLTIK